MRPARAARLMYQLPDSARLMRKLNPANNWGWQEMFLNHAVYMLQVLAWQNTKDAQAGPHTAPKIFMPDFMKKAGQAKGLDPDQETHTVDEIKDILSRPRH